MTVSILQHGIGEPGWGEALELRRAVLRTPLGLDYSPPDIAAERGDTLFAAYEGHRLVGVVMLRPDGADRVKLRQMAVLEHRRGHGIGERLVGAFEARAHELGIHHIGLAARSTAIGFYERLGYRCDGEEFMEVTIPHRRMSKAL